MLVQAQGDSHRLAAPPARDDPLLGAACRGEAMATITRAAVWPRARRGMWSVVISKYSKYTSAVQCVATSSPRCCAAYYLPPTTYYSLLAKWLLRPHLTTYYLRASAYYPQALRHCHDDALPGFRLMHRDVKPDNIGFLDDGRPGLTMTLLLTTYTTPLTRTTYFVPRRRQARALRLRSGQAVANEL